MKMIRASGVFNFREMIVHVNSNKKLQEIAQWDRLAPGTWTRDVRSFPFSRSTLACFNIALGR